MSKITIICCVAVLVASLPPIINSSTDVAIQDNPRFQRVQRMFREISVNRTIPTEKIFWNPQILYDFPFLTTLCANNIDGNYQNPYECNEFIMCAGGQVFIWWCPGDGSYDPITDLCIYPLNANCPWTSIWRDPAKVNCDYLGQRLWWSPTAFPTYPKERCGREIFFCFKYFTLGYSECPQGFGYSKAYLACIEKENCERIDAEFGL